MVHTYQGYERYPRERIREATAVYFEWLAQKETRDYDRRQRLSEVARFYRSLAGIVPAMLTQQTLLVQWRAGVALGGSCSLDRALTVQADKLSVGALACQRDCAKLVKLRANLVKLCA
ncbi:MAG TPA: hypothetical protein VKE42_02290 [Candidatus Cybelea sp.]|nr:hypothetical protein [Candidatus Cybelea sp.]